MLGKFSQEVQGIEEMHVLPEIAGVFRMRTVFSKENPKCFHDSKLVAKSWFRSSFLEETAIVVEPAFKHDSMIMVEFAEGKLPCHPRSDGLRLAP